MQNTLVGYTGFVGGNLTAEHTFNNLYNSSNIKSGFGAENGLVVYSGMSSEKFLANADPKADLARAEQALENIRRLRPEKLVLISTVDVYPSPIAVYEDTPINTQDALAYGKHRRMLEEWVSGEYPEALLVRLPGLFGKGLKKNLIYDMFTLVPSMVTEEKYRELCAQSDLIEQSYAPAKAGFYGLQQLEPERRRQLKNFFENNSFNSLCFTDSRSVFQFYDLSRLWGDISTALEREIRLLNLATEPVSAGEVYQHVFGKEFVNHLQKPPANYDMRSRYASLLGGKGDYIATKEQVLQGITSFSENWKPE